LGYALACRKSVQVESNRLTIIVEAKNTGEKAILLEEYCHNFVTIENKPLSDAYSLKMPVVNMAGKTPILGQNLCGSDGGVAICGRDAGPSLLEISAENIYSQAPFTWTLAHGGSSLSLSERVDFNPVRVVVWALDHIVSPEVIGAFRIDAGARARWTRSWTFDAAEVQ
jgi:hypothetical protein